ncbi:MAG TPA: helix-turn-helix domain-containing protein [Galbitalea sp.]|jgi:AraC-like DNA-binding protein|nr:helix-turn-helix domain-containing protein [Galbitalea sp.]
MKHRRRVDWSIILGADQPAPKVLDRSGPGGMAALLSTFDELRALDDPDAIIRRAVELARTRIGLARVAIFLFDKGRDRMLGTWGSDLRGRLVDEHQIMYAVSDPDREAFRRAEEGGEHFTVFADCPIIGHRGSETLIGGRGWVAWTPILASHARIGILFNDAGLTGAPLDAATQEQAAILCSFLGTVLDPVRSSQGPGDARADESSSSRGRATAAAKMLARDPELSGADVAARLDVSKGRLAHVFKAEIGISMVEYRNRIRLNRFTMLLDKGRRNLLEAALAAGFGSYAQFHRVFRSLRHMTPREYLRQRA